MRSYHLCYLVNRKQNKANNLFPKIGGMAMSSYSNNSHFSNMFQIKSALENSSRGNTTSNNEPGTAHLEATANFKTLEQDDDVVIQPQVDNVQLVCTSRNPKNTQRNR